MNLGLGHFLQHLQVTDHVLTAYIVATFAIYRGIPERVYPFSKGVCRNLYDFCCVRSIYSLESLPSAQELEEKLRPYTCSDVLTCRCC